jgi:hypothetical protein
MLRQDYAPSGEYPPSRRDGCVCVAWSDRQRIPLGSETTDLLETDFVLERERNPWLGLVACKGCGQRWYVAIDTVDDDYYFLRLPLASVEAILNGKAWPNDYDDFVNVWPGRGQGVLARLSWPWKSSS